MTTAKNTAELLIDPNLHFERLASPATISHGLTNVRENLAHPDIVSGLILGVLLAVLAYEEANDENEEQSPYQEQLGMQHMEG
jgi:hypothetical protein